MAKHYWNIYGTIITDGVVSNNIIFECLDCGVVHVTISDNSLYVEFPDRECFQDFVTEFNTEIHLWNA